MREAFATLLRVHIPNSLQARLDATAAQSARTRSDVVREAVIIGLDQLTRRTAGSENPPKAA